MDYDKMDGNLVQDVLQKAVSSSLDSNKYSVMFFLLTAVETGELDHLIDWGDEEDDYDDQMD
jgi:hypothetical protein